MPANVVYIASSPHSGSTLLELALSCHPQIMGIGEIFQFFVHFDRFSKGMDTRWTTDGVKMSECPFWVDMLEAAAAEKNISDTRIYEIILQVFEKHFGTERVLVDSSKHLRGAKALKQVVGDRLKVIHLKRDVRSWSMSRLEAFQKSSAQTSLGLKYPYQWATNTSYALFWKWYLENRAFDKFFTQSGTPVFDLGYEQFCYNTAEMLSVVCPFMGVEYDEAMIDIRNARGVSALGNRMRKDESKRSSISYDYRWFLKDEWLLPYYLFFSIRGYNKQRCYNSDLLKKWKS